MDNNTRVLRQWRPVFRLFVASLAACSARAYSSNGANSVPDPSSEMKMQAQLLEKARLANNDLYASLKSFVCQEEIQRFQGNPHGNKARSIDHVSANLAFENGVERYYDIRQNTRSLASMSAIAGAWSVGEFGTLLQQTAQLLASPAVSYVGAASLAGDPAIVYRVRVTEEQSPWDLAVGTQHYRIPFTTDVWISTASGEILKITRKSIAIPDETQISEIVWDVTLDAVNLNGRAWHLPTAAAYTVTYAESKRREWNQMSFFGYRRYSAESSLRFEGFQ